MRSGLVFLATGALTCALASACGPSTSPSDGGDAMTTMDIAMTDAPSVSDATDRSTTTDARRDAQAPADPCATDAVVDLTSMTLSGGMLHYTGNSNATMDMVGPQPPAGCIQDTTAYAGHVVALHYRMHANAGLIVTTSATETPASFDTVVWMQTACSTTAMPLACNDDDPADPPHSTVASEGPLTMGTDVFIFVGGYSPAVGSNDMSGAFGLIISEVAPTAVGMPCVDGTDVCTTGAHCYPLATDHTMATCQTDGAAGAQCRMTTPRCDGALACSAMTATEQGICRAIVPSGMACDPDGFASICMTPAVCTRTNVTTGSCVAPAMEHEPNDTASTAQGPVTMNTAYSASIMPDTDQDCFSVTVSAGQSLIVETNDGMGDCPPNADTYIRVFNVAPGTDAGSPPPIAENDDTMFSACSQIDGSTTGPLHAMAAGTYEVCVSAGTAGGAAMAIPNYKVDIAILP